MNPPNRITIQVTPEQLKLIIAAIRATAINLMVMAEEMMDMKAPSQALNEEEGD